MSRIPDRELGRALRRGATLPARWYSDPEILALEKRRIFARSWHYVGHLGQVPRPGDYFTCVLGDIPIVVVRGDDGELRAHVNVCRHRASEVARGEGRAKALICPYHGWTYGLDGRLLSAPRSDRESGFDPCELGLAAASVATWGNLVFVHPRRDAAPFEQAFAPLLDLDLEGHGPSDFRFHSRTEWQIDANWKVLSENYLECYHCPLAHPGFSRLMKVDAEGYANRAEGKFFLSRTPLRESIRAGELPEGAPYDPRGGIGSGTFVLLWPHTTLNLMPGMPTLYVLGFTPVDAGRTRGYRDFFVGPDFDEQRFTEMTDYLALLGGEDRELVESVQRGLRSGAVPHGRLMLDSEHLIQRFQALVYEALSPGD